MIQPATIIWDWNGTLLNDLQLCISSINTLLARRHLPLLDKASYQEVFSFPVKDYYAAIGFDFTREDFSIPAHQFIDLYEAGVESCPLHPAAKLVLSFFRQRGLKQYVLSAMHQDMLEKTLKHNLIFDYFDDVSGLNNHYAVSKVESGEGLLARNQITRETACLIGDTTHDFEVAQALGIQCILVADGHQSKERLNQTGALVMNTLGELLDWFESK